MLGGCGGQRGALAVDEPALPMTEVAAPETGADRRLIAALKAFIPEVMRAHGTPGLNIALARRGTVIWEAGFGYADLAAKRPMTPETVFHSGSMGKTYVATSVMQLVERGVLRLDAPVNGYLESFQVTNPLGDRPVTVRDLLTHHAGIGGNAAHSEFAKPAPLGEHMARAYAEPMFPPYQRTTAKLWATKVGERFEYSNLGMATLGYLVEITNPDGLSFSEYVQRNIMDPLRMRSSRYPPVQDSAHVGAEIWSRMSTGYTGLAAVHVPTPTIYFADYPAGTVVSTPGEHIRLILAYLGKGTYQGAQLLEPETVEQMLSKQADAWPGIDIGLTWQLWNVGKPNFSFGHGGAHMYGWHNNIRAFPGLDFAVAIATNHWRLPTIAVDREYSQIEAFIENWVQLDFRGADPDRSIERWAWKTSYVQGLLVVDNLKGQLGIASPITEEMIDAMATGATVGVDPATAENGWDAAGFRAGVRDMLNVVMIPDSVRAFLASDRLQVTKEEYDRIAEELGNRLIPLLGGPML